MPTVRRSSTVAASFEDVWEFHSTIEGLEALTPRSAGLIVERVVGPDGTLDPEVLEAGSEIDLSVRPLAVGPTIQLAVRIVERERTGGRAMFRDELIDGPLETWTHTHRFYGDTSHTRVVDRVEFAVDSKRLGTDVTAALEQGLRLGLQVGFAYRHRQMAHLLEGFSVERG